MICTPVCASPLLQDPATSSSTTVADKPSAYIPRTTRETDRGLEEKEEALEQVKELALQLETTKAAVREMQEESGLLVSDAALRGILSFDMRGDGNRLEVHVFHAQE